MLTCTRHASNKKAARAQSLKCATGGLPRNQRKIEEKERRLVAAARRLVTPSCASAKRRRDQGGRRRTAPTCRVLAPSDHRRSLSSRARIWSTPLVPSANKRHCSSL